MVLQNHEANVPFVEQNGIHTQANIVFTDADGKEVAIEVKSKKLVHGGGNSSIVYAIKAFP